MGRGRLVGHFVSEQTRAKIGAGNKGKHLTEETKNRIAITLKGRYITEETRAKLSASLKGRHLSQEHKNNVSKGCKGIPCSEDQKAKMSVIMKKKWQDREYAKKVLAYSKPNKAELKLEDILDRRSPGEWKFVGDGQLIIGGRCPDFVNVNGKKELIELFTAYWHPMFDVAQRKEHYRQYGFRVAIIWEDELEDEERLVKTLKRKLR